MLIKTLNEISKLSGDDESEIEILVGERHIIFKYENCEIISRLLEGNFINYKAAIPLTSSTQIKVNTRSLIECIERTSLIITVDNGISAIEEIQKAKELNIDVVVTDHHQAGEVLPDA